MFIGIKWFGNQFNVNLSSEEGKPEFLSIKGCRIMNGEKGQFVSYPATKKDNGEWWRHVWASDKFNEAVLEVALESMPAEAAPRGKGKKENIPF